MVAILGAIILHFLLAAIGTISLSFLVSEPSSTSIGGIGPVLWNSVYILVLTLLITVPLGILGGIYMAEYAGRRAGHQPDPVLPGADQLGAVDRGRAVRAGAVRQRDALGLHGARRRARADGLQPAADGRLAEQAIRAVPDDERPGSLALGTTKWQTIRHVVLPLAIPGIVTGIILTAGRIFGEAAALLFTAGLSTPSHYDFGNLNLTDSRSPWSPFHPATTLSVYIWKLNSEGLGSFVRQIADTTSAVLVLMVLGFNLGARGLGRALQRRVTGG